MLLVFVCLFFRFISFHFSSFWNSKRTTAHRNTHTERERKSNKFQDNSMQKKKKKQQIAEQPKEFRYSRHTITPAFFNTSNVSVCLGLGFRMVLGGSERVRKRKRMERERARDKKIIHFYFVSEFFLLLLHLILFDRRFWIRSHTIWSQTFANPIQWQFLKQLNSDQYKHNTQFKHTFSITFSELNNNNNSKAISTTHTRTHTQRRQKKMYTWKVCLSFRLFWEATQYSSSRQWQKQQ